MLFCLVSITLRTAVGLTVPLRANSTSEEGRLLAAAVLGSDDLSYKWRLRFTNVKTFRLEFSCALM